MKCIFLIGWEISVRSSIRKVRLSDLTDAKRLKRCHQEEPSVGAVVSHGNVMIAISSIPRRSRG